jgi:uncharacterized membrane protein YbhN (UPF0104 family)
MALRNIAIGALKVSVAGLLVWLVLRRIDFARAFSLIADFPLVLGAIVMSLFLAQALLSSMRWRAMSSVLAGAPLPFLPAFKFFMLAVFYNQALPSFVPGDAARVWGAARFSDLRRATLGVVLDRSITLVSLLALSGLGLLLLIWGHHQIPGAARTGFLVLFLGGLAAVLLLFLFRRRIFALLPVHIRDMFLNLGLSLRGRRLGGDMAGWLALSLVIHGTNIAAVWCLAAGMELSLSPLAAFTTVPLAMVAALLPITVNGWGVREGVMVLLLANFGIGSTEAATLSVLFGLSQLIFGLAAGLFMLIPTPATPSGDDRPASVE